MNDHDGILGSLLLEHHRVDHLAGSFELTSFLLVHSPVQISNLVRLASGTFVVLPHET